MTGKTPSFSFGIEEEYLLIDRMSRDLAQEPPRALLVACRKALGSHFSREYIRAQIEISTPVCTTPDAARQHLTHARRVIADVAAGHGLAPIAAGTHPFARWGRQAVTDTERYRGVAHDLAGPGRRMIINGLHVHVGVPNRTDRIRLMTAVRPWLPVLLALSASSPFWQGEDTGLASYRTAINDATPRKGVPEAFESWAHYQRAVRALRRAGIVEDASKIWWDVRPSVRFPTLEMRISDVCPLVDDALCIAALYRCLRAKLLRDLAADTPTPQPLLLINENRWRAERHGIDAGLIDPTTGRLTPFPVLIERLVAAVRNDAEAFGCVPDVEHVRTILKRGNSASRQRARFAALRAGGSSRLEALQGVVDMLAAETAGRQLRTVAKRPLRVPGDMAMAAG